MSIFTPTEEAEIAAKAEEYRALLTTADHERSLAATHKAEIRRSQQETFDAIGLPRGLTPLEAM